MNKLSYCKYCRLPKHQCQCTSGEWSVNYEDDIKTEHKHIWHIDKLAGFIKTGIEGAYIICQDCGEVRLVEVNKSIL